MAEFLTRVAPAVSGPPLVQNLLRDYSLVEEFYTYDPLAPESFQQRAKYLEQAWSGNRQALVEELVRYNREIGADSLALTSAEALLDPRSVAIITGQQAGVATGPLFTIHKAITVIRKAKFEAQHLGRPVVPVFWVAAEDHDWQEIASFSLLTKEGALAKLSLPFTPDMRSSVGEVSVPEEAVQTLMQEIRDLLQDTEFKEPVITELYEAWKRTENTADWFAAFLAYLFRDTGLVFVNPTSRALRSLISFRFEDIILNNARYRAAVETGVAKLKQSSYPVQVELMENSALLFINYLGARTALEVTPDGHSFAIRGEQKVYSKQEMVGLIREDPTRFSPNVLVRPLIQDTLFPTLGYVGGAAEVSYHAMIKGIFEVADEQMSILIPRFHITLIEKAQLRILEKYEFHPRDFFKKPKPVEIVLKKADTIGVDARFEALKHLFETEIESLTEDLQTLDPGVVQLSKDAISGVNHRLEQFFGKTKQLFRKRHDTIIKQFERVEAAIAPHGHLQERELNILSFLVKYGPGFVADLLESVQDETFGRVTDVYL